MGCYEKLALADEKRKNDQCNFIFIEHVMKNDKNINHYTAFPSRVVLDSLFEYLNPGEIGNLDIFLALYSVHCQKIF